MYREPVQSIEVVVLPGRGRATVRRLFRKLGGTFRRKKKKSHQYSEYEGEGPVDHIEIRDRWVERRAVYVDTRGEPRSGGRTRSISRQGRLVGQIGLAPNGEGRPLGGRAVRNSLFAVAILVCSPYI